MVFHCDSWRPFQAEDAAGSPATAEAGGEKTRAMREMGGGSPCFSGK
jgi:hypothetical protein